MGVGVRMARPGLDSFLRVAYTLTAGVAETNDYMCCVVCLGMAVVVVSRKWYGIIECLRTMRDEGCDLDGVCRTPVALGESRLLRPQPEHHHSYGRERIQTNDTMKTCSVPKTICLQYTNYSVQYTRLPANAKIKTAVFTASIAVSENARS